MKTIISSLHFNWTDMETCLTFSKNKFGMDGVELSFHESFAHPHCTKEDIAAIRKINEPLEMHLFAHIWEDIAKLGEKAVKLLLAWADICKETGAEGLIIHGGSFPNRKEGISRTRRVLEQVIPDFEKSGLVLYLENHYAYDWNNCNELFSEPWEFVELFTEIESDSLKFCFDAGHGNLTENSNQLITELAEYLHHIHLADNYGEKDDHCGYKDGSVAWDSFWNIMEEIKFNGTFCIEFPVRENLVPFSKCIQDIDVFRAKVIK